MAAIYDELGNVIGDDGTPSANEWDTNSPLPTQDEMKLALAKAKDYTAPIKAAIQNLPGAPLAQAAASMGSDMLGQVAGIPYGIYQSIKNGTYGTQAGVQQAQASGEPVAEALRYTPPTQAGRDIVEGIGQGFEAAKLPPYIGHMPEMRFNANDARVLAKQNIERAREVAAIPEDFRNAQSGINRESNLGGNTYGVNLQAAASDIGDVAARQAARRSETGARPGSVQVFSDLVPETNMYAVRPTGYGQYVEPSDLPNGVSAVGKVPGNVVNQLEDNLKRGEDPESRFMNYYSDFIGSVPHVDQAWQDFSNKKLREMYPDAPDLQAARQAFNFSHSEDLGHHARLKMLDEFSETPEAKAALQKRSEERQKLHDELYVLKNAPRKGMTEEKKAELNDKADEIEELLSKTPAIDLPNQEQVGQRNKAISEFFKKDFRNELVKWIGTGQGPTMELAKRGITHVPAKELLANQVNDPNSYANKDLIANRKAAGLPEQGFAGELLAKKEAELKTASDAFNKLNSRKNQLAMQHQADNPENPDPTTNAVIGPEYKELTNQIDNAYRAKEKLEKEAENLKVARAYEGLSDVAFKPTTAKEARQMDYARKQFYPHLFKTLEEPVPFGGMMKYHAIPDEAPMFNIRSDFIRDLGYVDIAKQYSDAIMKGEIPIDEKTGKPTLRLDKFIEEHAAPRIKKEEKERLAERNKIGNLQKYMKSLVDTIPAEATFKNAKALEMTSETPWEDIRRHTSLAGLVFDHCIAQSDAPHPGTNPFTGQRYTHSYPVDPVTGKPRLNAGETAESVNHSSQYMRGTRSGEKRLTVLMDAESGMPVGAIEFRDGQNGKYNLGYIQSHKTDSIKKPYRDAFKDYLNARSDIINGIGSDLNKHDIFDMTVPAQVNKAFQAAGMPKSDVSQLDLPRFVSKEDIERAVPINDVNDRSQLESRKLALTHQLDRATTEVEATHIANQITEINGRLNQLTNAPDTHASLTARKQRLVNDIEEYRHDLRDAQRDDPMDHEEHERIQDLMDEARNQIRDINSRLENISSNVRNAPAMPTPRDIAAEVIPLGAPGRETHVENLTVAINNAVRNLPDNNTALNSYIANLRNANELPRDIIDITTNYDQAERVANYLIRQAQNRVDSNLGRAPAGNQLAPAMNQVEAQRVRDTHLLQREGVQRGLSTAGNPANVREAYHDILNDLDPDATPEDAMHHLSIVHDIVQDPETDLHREFGIQDENQVGQLINLLERHMTAIEPQLAANRNQVQNAPVRAQLTDDQAVQTIDNAVNYVADHYGELVQDYANETLQGISEHLDPAENTTSYIAQLRRLAGERTGPRHDALTHIADSLEQAAGLRNQVQNAPAIPQLTAEYATHITDQIAQANTREALTAVERELLPAGNPQGYGRETIDAIENMLVRRSQQVLAEQPVTDLHQAGINTLEHIMDTYGENVHDNVRAVTNFLDDRIDLNENPTSYIAALRREAADQTGNNRRALTEMADNLREAHRDLRAAPVQNTLTRIVPDLNQNLQNLNQRFGEQVYNDIRHFTDRMDEEVESRQDYISRLRDAADNIDEAETAEGLNWLADRLENNPGQLENDLAGGDWIAEEEPANPQYNSSLQRIDSSVAHPGFQFENYRNMHESIMAGNEEGTPWHNLSATERRRLNAYLDAQYTRRINNDLPHQRAPEENQARAPDFMREITNRYTNEATGSRAAFNTLDNELLTLPNRESIFIRLREVAWETSGDGRYSPEIQRRWGIDSPGGVQQFNRAVNALIEHMEAGNIAPNLPPPEGFKKGGRIKMAEGGEPPKLTPFEQFKIDNAELIRQGQEDIANRNKYNPYKGSDRPVPTSKGMSGGAGFTPGVMNPFNPDSPLNRKNGGKIPSIDEMRLTILRNK